MTSSMRDVYRRDTNRVAYRQNIMISPVVVKFSCFLKIDIILNFVRKLGNKSHPNPIFNQFSVVCAAKSFDSFSQKISKISSNIKCLNRIVSENIFI